MVQHELKCWPEYFQAMLDGVKTFDFRRNDRNYAVNDILVQREFNPHRRCNATGRVMDRGSHGEGVRCCDAPHGNYTGRQAAVKVVYMLSERLVPEGFAILGITDFELDESTVEERTRAHHYTHEIFGFDDDDDDIPISAGEIDALLAKVLVTERQAHNVTLRRSIERVLCNLAHMEGDEFWEALAKRVRELGPHHAGYGSSMKANMEILRQGLEGKGAPEPPTDPR